MSKSQTLPDRLAALKKLHNNQCLQLDLTLETTVRDSKYSNNLMEMMRREDSQSKDVNSPTGRQLSQKIDEALRAETKAFFTKVSQFNSKKWEMLAEKLRREREHIKNELIAQVFSVDPTGISMRISSSAHDTNSYFDKAAVPAQAGNPRTVTAEDIERESQRLEVDYYNNWYRYESYHLQEAFQSQLNRLDAEWQTHEQLLKDEYESKTASLTGRIAPVHGASSNNSDEPQRWHNAEKQKTLIHTAPVFSPTLPAHGTAAASRPQSGTAKKKDNTNAAMLVEVRINDK